MKTQVIVGFSSALASLETRKHKWLFQSLLFVSLCLATCTGSVHPGIRQGFLLIWFLIFYFKNCKWDTISKKAAVTSLTFIIAPQLLCLLLPTLPFYITLKHQMVGPIRISICIFRNQRQIYLQRKSFLPEIFPYFVQDWCPTEGCDRASSSCPRGWVCLVCSPLPLSPTLCKKAFLLYRRDNSLPRKYFKKST